MKRCPQCSFLYHDSDQFCDLDKTPLIHDDFVTGANVSEHAEQRVTKLPPAALMPERLLNLKTLSAAAIASLIVGLMLLLSYQRMRPTLQASQSRPTPPDHSAKVLRVSQVAHQASNEASAQSAIKEESRSSIDPNDDTNPSAEPLSSTPAKTAPETRPQAARVNMSSNPVSTGDVANANRGPVTIRLANGSTLKADEVWRTKAGIWYRRKGIVTLLKPNRVRSINN